MHVLSERVSDEPSACICCDHAYDAGRLSATLALAEGMRLPHGWRIPSSYPYPLSQQWVETFFNPILVQLRATDAPEWQNYPIRQAALCRAVMDHAPLDDETRRGIAWSLLRVGMALHHWRVRPASADARLLIAPPSDFWDQFDDLLVLAELLDRSYEYAGPAT